MSVMRVLLAVLTTTLLLSGAIAQTVDVTYTLGSPAGTVQPLLGVNAGPLHWDGKIDTKDVTTGFKTIGVRAVRGHDFPCALDMSLMYPDRSKDPSLQSSYNFASPANSGYCRVDYGSDTAVSTLRDNGLVFYMRLWDSANNLGAPSSGERANWVKAAVEVVRHYQEAKWNGFSNMVAYVEIGNEPDSAYFWPTSYTKEEFYALYADTAKALRAAFPTLKIGGPAVTQSGFKSSAGQQWTRGFLDHVKSSGAPLDFFSWHMYSNTPEDYATGANFYRTELTNRGFSSTEQHVTEWNTEVSPTNDPTADAANLVTRTMGKGAAITTASWIVLQQSGIRQAFLYRANDPSAADHSRYGLFSTDALPRKPALAFSLWSEFAGYGDRIDPSASASVTGLKTLAARRSDGQIAMLVANTGTASQRYTLAFSDSRRLSDYALSLKTVDDSRLLVNVSIPTGTTFEIAPNSVQLLTLHVKTGSSYVASSTVFGSGSGLLLAANLSVAGADIGKTGSIWLAALAGSTLYFHNGTGWVVSSGGNYPAYSSGALPPVVSIPIFPTATPTQPYTGIQILIGYGTSVSEMLGAGRYRSIHTFAAN